MDNLESKNQNVAGNGKGGSQNQKEFGLSSFSIDNRISVLVLVLLLRMIILRFLSGGMKL